MRVHCPFFELAKIAYVERPAWQDIYSCISPIKTVRSYVRPVFWPFSHGYDEIRGANRLISFSRCNSLAILRSDLLRDVVPLGHHNWHLACLSDWSDGKHVCLSLDNHLRSLIAIASKRRAQMMRAILFASATEITLNGRRNIMAAIHGDG